jgi:hypothetical protein
MEVINAMDDLQVDRRDHSIGCRWFFLLNKVGQLEVIERVRVGGVPATFISGWEAGLAWIAWDFFVIFHQHQGSRLE